MPLKTGSELLDSLLDGGLEKGIITEVFGEGGSGKTSLALQLAVRCAEGGGKALYIDNEGVSPERLRQIAGKGHKALLTRILFFHPHSSEELEDHVSRVIKLAEKDGAVRLVVVDTISTFYRQAIGTKAENQTRSLITNLATRLMHLARVRDLSVLITNQVYFDPQSGTIEPLGGQGLGHMAKTILRLERTAPSRRTMVLMKHRHRAEGAKALLVVTDRGLEDG